MKKSILVVDDTEINRDLLQEILETEYTVITAENGEEAAAVLDSNCDEIGIILLDIFMPKMTGYDVMLYMKEKGYLEKIPVLIISGEQSVESEQKCFDMGASDFIRKPFDERLVRRRVKNIAELYSYKNYLEHRVKEQTKNLRAQNEKLRTQAQELRKNNENIIGILGAVVESRDLESGEHIQRVKGYTQLLAKQLMEDCPEYGLTEKDISLIVEASALHDIGKIAIPDNILLKPGKLTLEEYETMKTHTIRGCEVLSKIESAWDDVYSKYSYEICRHHHERYDGKGYPDGLKGDEIPVSAQCVSIADVYDALVNVRCYKEAYTHEKAYSMIMNGECGTFSPKLLAAFAKQKEAFARLEMEMKQNN